ncbi:hypothetical protein ACFQZS_09520 [Mucilaginibacter calamicampi]|uniref:Uncharacterized protein n=1 Tax=Mucilaginibacter calamicampi TaxID=1302352 RepID=A0ABW2YVW0_9SPHI
MINQSTQQLVALEEGELVLDYGSDSIKCQSFEIWANNCPFLLNSDLKTFLLESNPTFISNAKDGSCFVKVPVVKKKNKRIDSLLNRGYKISITFNFNNRAVLLKEIKELSDTTFQTGVMQNAQKDVLVLANVISKKTDPISPDRLNTYKELISILKAGIDANNLQKVEFVHNEMQTMSKAFEQYMGPNKMVVENKVKIKVNILGNTPVRPRRVIYCTNADFFLKNANNYKSFPTLQGPFEAYLEKHSNYQVWVSDPGSFEPISDVKKIEITDDYSPFDLLIK